MIWRTVKVMTADLAPWVIGVGVAFWAALFMGWLLNVPPFIGLVFAAVVFVAGGLIIVWISNAYERAKKSEQGH